MKKISEEKRGIIINLLDSGLSAREIAKQCNVG
jgi:IS30 family transposase